MPQLSAVPFSISSVLAKVRSIEVTDPLFYIACGGVILVITGFISLVTGGVGGAVSFSIGITALSRSFGSESNKGILGHIEGLATKYIPSAEPYGQGLVYIALGVTAGVVGQLIGGGLLCVGGLFMVCL